MTNRNIVPTQSSTFISMIFLFTFFQHHHVLSTFLAQGKQKYQNARTQNHCQTEAAGLLPNAHIIQHNYMGFLLDNCGAVFVSTCGSQHIYHARTLVHSETMVARFPVVALRLQSRRLDSLSFGPSSQFIVTVLQAEHPKFWAARTSNAGKSCFQIKLICHRVGGGRASGF